MKTKPTETSIRLFNESPTGKRCARAYYGNYKILEHRNKCKDEIDSYIIKNFLTCGARNGAMVWNSYTALCNIALCVHQWVSLSLVTFSGKCVTLLVRFAASVLLLMVQRNMWITWLSYLRKSLFVTANKPQATTTVSSLRLLPPTNEVAGR